MTGISDIDPGNSPDKNGNPDRGVFLKNTVCGSRYKVYSQLYAFFLCAFPTLHPAPWALHRLLFHRHTLGQVSRLIHIGPAEHGDMIGQKLQRHYI